MRYPRLLRPRAAGLITAAAAILSTGVLTHAAEQPTLLLRQPSLSDRQLAFVYAGDLWVAGRDGSDPRRLTSDPADERRPYFSPDGRFLAFTAEYGGNTDVYVMPAEGGPARRLTFHPRPDEVTGWSADGKRVAFVSAREVGNGRAGQLYEVASDGGPPHKVMAAPFFRGAWHGDEIAYIAFGPGYNGLYGGTAGWRGYRGGDTPSIRILDLAGERMEAVPGAADGSRSNDLDPMWDGDTLYFLSDRDDKVLNVYRFDRAARRVERVSNETTWDVRSATVRDGTVVYETGGRLVILDPDGGRRELPITLAADLPAARPQWKNASANIETVLLSPTGKRALITARGEVFSVPTEHGSTRNLTATDGVREYTGLWSPDGERIAYVIDDGNRQTMAVIDQAGLEAPRSYRLDGAFNALLEWGGDGRHIAYEDNHLTLHVLDLASGRSRRVATHDVRAAFDVATSPDGKWLAYTLARPNRLSDLMLYDLERQRSIRVSDGMVNVAEVAFSPDGAYLYFTASTNTGQTLVGLDLSSRERPRRLAVYGLVLAADGTSPLAPRTGDEGSDDEPQDADEDKDADTPAAAPPTRVDPEGIAGRIVALPLPLRNYSDLAVDHDGNLFYVDRVQPGASEVADAADVEADNTLQRFDFDERESETISDGITGLVLSHDGKYLLVSDTEGALLGGKITKDIELEPIDTSGMQMRIDPRREWAQIFRDAWRMEQAYFYAENLHGVDWNAVYRRYQPLLAHAGRREDVNDLMVQMIAELQVGHNRVGGGDIHHGENEAAAGLLGADLRVENGRYRIATIYDGEHWNPLLAAPLARPELDIRPGDYLLAINGRPLTGTDNVFERLQGTSGKQTQLTVARDAAGRSVRTVVVEPTDDERELRLWNWVESKRRRVDEATKGRVAYVYLPDTAGGGYTFFNRMFFAQADKQALIVDERSNSGGQAANYIIDVLNRSYLSSWRDREGLPFDTPGGAVYGPKAMLIDQDAGSGGDFLPYAFRHTGLGSLIGTRTWGGLIGIAANPALVDGGALLVPYFRFYDASGNWAVENEGVAPDIEVELDPLRFNAGQDVQLECAIDEVMAKLSDYQPVRHPPPPLPTEPGR